MPGFVRGLFVVGPHAGAHRVAARAGLSVCVPLLLLVSTGHTSWVPYAAFGAFTSLFGRRKTHGDRVSMQMSAAACFVGAVTLGCTTALLPGAQWLVVGVGALFTAVVSVISDLFEWHPPGPLFPLFGFAVCAMMPPAAVQVLVGFLVSLASALFSMFVGYVGVWRDPGPRGSVTMPHARRSPREVLELPGTRVHLVLSALSVGIAGGLATLIGGEHPYWAMVAAAAALSGPTMRARMTRGVHRLLGTLIGVALAGVVLTLHPHGLWAVGVIVVMQVGAELFVGRNYALAVLFITPMALMMGQLGHEAPVGPLLKDRFLETCLGCVVSMAVLAMFTARD